MDPWTPVDRNEFIEHAVTSKSYKGYKGPYNYRVFPKSNGNDSEDPRRSLLTQTLAKVVYEKSPEYRALSLKFYQLLMTKIMEHFPPEVFCNDIVVLLKGGNSYAFLLSEKYPEEFPFSDLDVVIYINPYLPSDYFNNIKNTISTIVLQTISQYKRTLDHMLFINKPIQGAFLTDEQIAAFKRDFNQALGEVQCEDGFFMSPFENDQIRNSCSKNSYLIENSKVHEKSAVQIEVPHFDRCERIPLRKTPLFASFNKTISFKRDKNDSLNGDFELYRLRFNCVFVSNNTDEGSEGECDDNASDVSSKEERVTADFIDVSIALQDDAELIDFWNRGRYLNILDKISGVWFSIPDGMSCLMDLQKMLTVYDCPEHKREKREKKFMRLKQILKIEDVDIM